MSTPRVGDMADHISGVLDPRPVAEASADRNLVKLLIGTLTTEWLPAANYTYKAVNQRVPSGER